jgi:hypothetical protein
MRRSTVLSLPLSVSAPCFVYKFLALRVNRQGLKCLPLTNTLAYPCLTWVSKENILQQEVVNIGKGCFEASMVN